jgi:hypothetical protein
MRTSARFQFCLRLALFVVFVFPVAAPVVCQQASIQLPQPQVSGGMPLMQAVAQRKTTRTFRDQPLSSQTLSNLLWAAFGVNRTRDVKPDWAAPRPRP